MEFWNENVAVIRSYVLICKNLMPEATPRKLQLRSKMFEIENKILLVALEILVSNGAGAFAITFKLREELTIPQNVFFVTDKNFVLI